MLLFGVPRRRRDGVDAVLPPGRATELAALLALRADWFVRDELVAHLWPDADVKRGRHNLSQLLYAARRSAWGDDLEAEPTRVRWTVATDVAAFRQAAAEGDWRHASELYAGDLLEGTAATGADGFDAWLQGEREDLRETWHEALRRHATDLADAGQSAESARLLRRLLASDDLLEDAVQALMRLEARAGRRDAALQVYDAFRARLATELGLEPLDATAQLAAAVRRGDLAANLAEPTGPHADDPPAPATAGDVDATRSSERDVRPGPVRGLAADATAFVGRALELTELHARLAEPGRRLATVLGPGGTGKSRVARQLARERAGHFEEGAAWVPLGTAGSEAEAVAAIAGALGIRVEPSASALAALLGDQELLLVLDQVEHLGDGPDLVATLLDACPRLCLVATSRHALDLPGEAVVPLAGLSVPPRDDAPDAEAYDAVGLLLRAAHRVRPDFHPEGPERTAAVALTRLLAGSPLAIELAAGWLRVLEPSELLREVARDLDVLRAADGDGPGPHTSLRAAFESSWTLLGDGEREGLRRLAVFHGGCTRETARAVADVPLRVLLALTNRSLLYRDGTRFAAHPVVQRYAQDKLEALPDLAADLGRRHLAFFLALAEDADRRLDTPEQREALALLTAEAANLSRALERAITAGDADPAYALTAALGRFWRWRGHLTDGLAWSERVRALPLPAPTAASVRAMLGEGLLFDKQGRYARADAAFERAEADAAALGDPGLATAARCDRAIVAWRRGDLATARTLLEDVCASYRALGREVPLAGSLGNLGNVMRDSGDLEGAQALFDETLALAERVGHVWEMANVRNNKAIALAYAGDLEAARGEFERALELQRSIDNRPGISMSLTNLGNVYLDTGAPERAEALYREALALCEELGDRDGLAHLHVNLGILAQRRGAYDEAHERYGQSLRLRRAAGARALATQSISCFLDLAVARGAHERALVLAGAVRSMASAIGAPLTGPQQLTYDDALAAARAAVPDERATELERRGEALGAREAVAFALAERAVA